MMCSKLKILFLILCDQTTKHQTVGHKEVFLAFQWYAHQAKHVGLPLLRVQQGLNMYH